MAPGGFGPVEYGHCMRWSRISERTTKRLEGSLDRRIELLRFAITRRRSIDPSDQVQRVYGKENDSHLTSLAESKQGLLDEPM